MRRGMIAATLALVIDPSDNRGAGSVMGNALEGWCEDQPVRIRIVG